MGENRVDCIWEEIKLFLYDDELYEVIKIDGNSILIKANTMEDGVPYGFNKDYIIANILSRIIPYGKITMEISHTPKHDKITIDFDMIAHYRQVNYNGIIEVIRE